MGKRILSLFLVAVICAVPPAASARGQEKALKVKAAVAKIGTGPATRVEVNLGNHVVHKGYVAEANENDFVVSEPKTGVTVKVPYAQVRSLKGRDAAGHRVSVSGGAPVNTLLGLSAIGVIVIAIAVGASADN